MKLLNHRIPFDFQSPHTAEETSEKLLSLQTANKRTQVRAFEHKGIPRVNIDRLMGRNLGVSLSATLTQEGDQTRVKGTVGLASSTVMVVVLFIVFGLNMSLMPLLALVLGQYDALIVFLFVPPFVVIVSLLVRKALKERTKVLSDIQAVLGLSA